MPKVSNKFNQNLAILRSFSTTRLSKYYRPLPGIDEWIRRRIRMCVWKQWRHVRTKIRELRKLGVSLNQAVKTGSSGKSYWRLSKTLATNSGMSLKWFRDELGLLSVRELWIAFHYPKG